MHFEDLHVAKFSKLRQELSSEIMLVRWTTNNWNLGVREGIAPPTMSRKERVLSKPN